MSAMAFQITCVSIVYSTICSGTDQRQHQSSASLAFVRGIHRWPVNAPHKGPVTRNIFPFDDVIMLQWRPGCVSHSSVDLARKGYRFHCFRLVDQGIVYWNIAGSDGYLTINTIFSNVWLCRLFFGKSFPVQSCRQQPYGLLSYFLALWQVWSIQSEWDVEKALKDSYWFPSGERLEPSMASLWTSCS